MRSNETPVIGNIHHTSHGHGWNFFFRDVVAVSWMQVLLLDYVHVALIFLLGSKSHPSELERNFKCTNWSAGQLNVDQAYMLSNFDLQRVRLCSNIMGIFFKDFLFLLQSRRRSLEISLSRGWFHKNIEQIFCLRLGTVGRYSVANDRILLLAFCSFF